MNKQYNNHKDFLAEAEDIVSNFNKNLYILKSTCNTATVQYPDVVNAVFREIHTLKGISEISGFPRISSLSHNLEDLLDCLRFGRIQLNYKVVDTLFEVADVFTELLNNINDQGEEYTEIGPVIEKMGLYLDSGIHDETFKNNRFAGLPYALLGRLPEFEQHRLMESVKEGRRIFRIIVRTHIDTVDDAMTELRANLTCYGEVITVMPVSGFSEDDMASFELLYSSQHEDILRRYELVSGTQMMQGQEFLEQVAEDRVSERDPLFSGEIISIQNIDLEGDPFETQIQEQIIDQVEPPPQTVKSIAKTVRVDIERLETLLDTVGEILLLNSTVTHLMNDLKMKYGKDLVFLDIHRSTRQLHKKIAFLRDKLIDIRLVPIEYLYTRLNRIVEVLSKDLSKKIKFEVSGGDTKLDKSIIEEIADPLMHIIRNAIDHGIEDDEVRRKRGKDPAGTIRITSVQRDGTVVIDIEDDGCGIDFDVIKNRALIMGLLRNDEMDEKTLLKMLFMPGFTTKNTIDDISGRGVGLDVVAKSIEDLSGMIEVETVYGKRTTFRITLPVTLLIVRALIVSESGREFAIPVNLISENLSLKECEIKIIRDRESINLRGDFLPLVRLKDVLKYHEGHWESYSKNEYVIIAGLAQKRMGIIVDKIHGQREILIKPPGKFLKEIQGIEGFAEIDARKVVPVIDVIGLAERVFA
ncbi:MAG: chemotaxis protein CheA [Nitrospirae bacterium]|nr:chemotaxis protein CheA [Nitrospirota bacterium]